MDYYENLLFSEDESVPDSPRIHQLWAKHFGTSEEEFGHLLSNAFKLDKSDSVEYIVYKNEQYYLVSYGPEPAYSVHVLKSERLKRLLARLAGDMSEKSLQYVLSSCLKMLIQQSKPITW